MSEDQVAKGRAFQLVGHVPFDTSKRGDWRPRSLSIPEAKRLAGAEVLSLRVKMLANWADQIGSLSAVDAMKPEALVIVEAFLIRYRNCFEGGVRYFHFSEKHVRACPSHDLTFHRRLCDIANTAIAHPDSWLEQAESAMWVNQIGETTGVGYQLLLGSPIRGEEMKRLPAIILELQNCLDAEIATLREICAAHVNALSNEERLRAEEVALLPKPEEDISKSRKAAK